MPEIPAPTITASNIVSGAADADMVKSDLSVAGFVQFVQYYTRVIEMPEKVNR